jgi:hypothetical protein
MISTFWDKRSDFSPLATVHELETNERMSMDGEGSIRLFDSTFVDGIQAAKLKSMLHIVWTLPIR